MSYGEISKVTNMTKGQIGGILERAGLTDPANGLFKTKGPRVERLPPAIGAIATAKPEIGISDVQQAKRLCQWIFGEPGPGQRWIDMDKCDAEALAGKPYCEDHCARAYHTSKG